MCLIPPIIHFYNEILGYKICFAPSQLSHTILSVSPRCNFFIAKMHQKSPHLHPPKLLIVILIIIIISQYAFSPLEYFFSFSHLDYTEIFLKERLQLLYNSLPFLLSGNRYFLRNKSTKMIRSAR